MIKVLFDLKQLYYWAMMKPICDELQKDSNFETAIRVGSNHKKIAGIFLISNKKKIEKELKSQGYKTTNQTTGYDFVFCGDTLKNPKEFGNAKLCHVDHSISIKSQRYRSLAKQSNVKYIRFVEGNYRLDKYKELGLDKQLELFMVGSAKLDEYHGNKFNKRKWSTKLNINNSKPIVLYAPSYKPTSIFDLGKEICSKSLSEKYNIIIKLHPYSWAGKYASSKQSRYISKLVNKNPNIILVPEHEHNAMPYLFLADTMISDASGVINEFLAINKCGIIFNKNYSKINHSDGQPVITEDLSSWLKGAFIHCNSANSISNCIGQAINPKPKQIIEIKKAANYICSMQDGKAATRIKEILLNKYLL